MKKNGLIFPMKKNDLIFLVFCQIGITSLHDNIIFDPTSTITLCIKTFKHGLIA